MLSSTIQPVGARLRCTRVYTMNSLSPASFRSAATSPLPSTSLLQLLFYIQYRKYYFAYRRSDKCFLPMSAGACRASMTRYLYNATARKCQRFTYGGCDGNSNNFESMELCEQECEYPLSPGDTHRQKKTHHNCKLSSFVFFPPILICLKKICGSQVWIRLKY